MPTSKSNGSLSKSIKSRVAREAKRQGMSAADFVRQCVIGRLNQIEATRRYWRR